MNEKRYVYHGPLSGFTLMGPDGPIEVMLHDGEPPVCGGKPTTLPADDPHVQSLVARRLLQDATPEEHQPEKARRAGRTTQNEERS